MQYNFNQKIEEFNSDSLKWNFMEDFFGEDDLIPMWIADMDFKCPQPVIDALKKRAESGIFGYTSFPNSLYEAIIGWLQRRHQWSVKQEWICHSPGVIPALSACINSFTNPGDRIIIQPPVYPHFARLIHEQGRELVSNPLRIVNGRYEMDLDDLSEKIKSSGAKMIILCSPHNPVGRVWSISELEQLTELCLANDMLIVSDEIHADLVFADYKHTPLAAISNKVADKTIICMAPSKTFNVAGLQASYIIIPNKELRDGFNKFMQNAHSVMSNTFAITASESAYNHGDEWLDQCLTYIRGNIDYLLEFMKKNLPELKVFDVEGTYLLWIDCRSLQMDTESLKQFMIKETRVALGEGSEFGKEGNGYLRMNLACKRTTLEKGLKRLERAVKSRIIINQ